MVISRFFHHITGTPMFHVDFSGGIGARSILVSDTKLNVERPFGDTQRVLFVGQGGTSSDGAGPSQPGGPSQPLGSSLQSQSRQPVESCQPGVQEDSDDDPDWYGDYVDFLSDEVREETSDGETPSFMEDPLRELGLYDFGEDVSSWPFEQVFADDQWQGQDITLEQNTDNFSGPVPGPTSAVGSHPTEYFMRYWPPHILQRVVDETNRFDFSPFCFFTAFVRSKFQHMSPLISRVSAVSVTHCRCSLRSLIIGTYSSHCAINSW